MFRKKTSSVKCIFPDISSDDSDASSDTDSDSDTEARRRRQKIKSRRPIQIPFPLPAITISSETEKTQEGTKSHAVLDGGEPGLFIIDSTGGGGNLAVKEKEKGERPSYSPLDPGVDLTKNLYINLDVLNRFSWKEEKEDHMGVEEANEAEVVAEVMKKATFKPSLEKNPTLPRVSKAEMKRRRKAEREKTKGRDWYNMPATELTEERRRDLEVMQMRDALDPKRRYRTEDRAVLPKYFQVGTVIEDATDFYNSRVPRKQRKQTIVEELLADAELQKRNKRKYAEIQQQKIRYRGKKADHGDQKEKGKKKKKRKVNE